MHYGEWKENWGNRYKIGMTIKIITIICYDLLPPSRRSRLCMHNHPTLILSRYTMGMHYIDTYQEPIPWVAAQAMRWPSVPKFQGSIHLLHFWFVAAIFMCKCSSWGTAIHRVLLCNKKWRVTTSQLNLPSLTPLFAAGCDRLQLGATH